MSYIWIPKTEYKDDNSIKNKIEIRPHSYNEVEIRCPKCKSYMVIFKRELLSDNKSFTCPTSVPHAIEGICGYTFAVKEIPDNIKYFLQNDTYTPPDVRPRIVRR